jgi:hypothetical protein
VSVPSWKRTCASKPSRNTPSIARFSGSTSATKHVIPRASATAASRSIRSVPRPRPWRWSATSIATSARRSSRRLVLRPRRAHRHRRAVAQPHQLRRVPVGGRPRDCARSARVTGTLRKVGAFGSHRAQPHRDTDLGHPVLTAVPQRKTTGEDSKRPVVGDLRRRTRGQQRLRRRRTRRLVTRERGERLADAARERRRFIAALQHHA